MRVTAARAPIATTSKHRVSGRTKEEEGEAPRIGVAPAPAAAISNVAPTDRHLR